MSKRKPYYKYSSAQYEKSIILRNKGYGYRDIAREIGVPWGTVRGWVSNITVCPHKAHELAMERRKKPLKTLSAKTNIRKRLLKERGEICEECELTEWRGKPLSFEVDHIDGNNQNNNPDNLKILCPNCHSQTPTWKRGKKAQIC